MSTTTVVRADEQPMEYASPRRAPRLLVIGTGVLGAAVLVQLLVGLAVIS